jgi:hypothetical protein
MAIRRSRKDETEEEIAGQPIPRKNLSPKKRHEFEKRRREERAKRGDPRVGDSFSSQRMIGSRGHGSEYENTRAIREEIISYLLDEGFASNEKSAESIMSAMSETWIESIFEAEIQPPRERVGNLTNINIPQEEIDAAKKRTLEKARRMREKRKEKKD